MCGYVALGQIHLHVERGITSPWPSNFVIKIQPVHLRTDEMPVDLLLDRPIPNIERPQPVLPRPEHLLLLGHGRRGVVRHPVNERRTLKVAPFTEQVDQVVPRRLALELTGGNNEKSGGNKRGSAAHGAGSKMGAETDRDDGVEDNEGQARSCRQTSRSCSRRAAGPQLRGSTTPDTQNSVV